MPTDYSDTGDENSFGNGEEPRPRRPYRNLAIALASLFGIISGCALSIYLGFNFGPLKGLPGVLVGFPTGVLAGSSVAFFVLMKLANLLNRRRKAARK